MPVNVYTDILYYFRQIFLKFFHIFQLAFLFQPDFQHQKYAKISRLSLFYFLELYFLIHYLKDLFHIFLLFQLITKSHFHQIRADSFQYLLLYGFLA